MNIENFKGQAISDAEFLDCLDYALDLLADFEAQAEICSGSLQKRAVTLMS